MEFRDILEKYRTEKLNNHDRGLKFEWLMRSY